MAQKMIMMIPQFCHCGKLMHLSDSQRVMLEAMKGQWGEEKAVIVSGKTYFVPTYYIILHGLKANEIPKLGFKEAKERS